MEKFSKRYGYSKGVRTIVTREEAPESLRYSAIPMS